MPTTTPDYPVVDRELAAALHALSAPMLSGRVERHIDAATRSRRRCCPDASSFTSTPRCARTPLLPMDRSVVDGDGRIV
jgi:hypothetical protein